ncbi:PepSY-associated TM helix domain-containing protein [Teredinibacter sp. KSP-S5-2]|uniref:PepSY-associated TM helix domain-containing protein n=1 Tax=Teredinibacter sp. KSP-S5-2 TaxID=3034506 RepID=UPI0029345534|nr:PepSY-associated TM helix domain-containing protein [Teredinibacter sp. KSP-S5-2]WNO08281.1 PepSY-associated TM helix domain-containing protein [Teredinibacter sp. KSP-S5-2]
MRHFFTLAHRYMGLTTALFLIITGLTGAVISWDHELDEWLNPHLTKVSSQGVNKNFIALAEKVEQTFPEIEVIYFELVVEKGHSLSFWVEPRVNPDTEQLFKPGFNQVFIDPVSGEILGTREWGAIWPISKETFVSFLYKLHFSLHIPEINGNDHWGIWLLGVIALIWILDCFISFCLTLPRRQRRVNKKAVPPVKRATHYLQRWKPAWLIRWFGGPTKLNFDLHRAFGLWTWAILLTIAFTAFSLNLYREIFYPVMSLVSDVTPTPLDERQPNDHHDPITPALSFADVLGLAEIEAQNKNWQKPVGSLWYAREWGIYRVEFFSAEEGHGSGGVGHNAIFFDGHDGRVLGDWVPWRGTAADLFVQAQFPLHSGRILGLPGRILISIMGVVIAMLSITGVIIWWKKYRARTRVETRKIITANEDDDDNLQASPV